MKNADYWKKRFTVLEKASNAYGQEAYHNIEAAFTNAQKSIQNEIEMWYHRFAKNNDISLADAKKMLTTKELAEFRWDVKEYIKHGKENVIDGRWARQLENASARYHVSRLEALQLRTQQAMEVAFGNQLDAVDHMARRVLTENYYHSVFEVQRGFNIGWNIGQIDERTLNKLVVKPWAGDGKNFSDRIWQKKTEMVSQLHKELTQTLIQGKAPDAAIKHMQQFVEGKVKNAKYAAARIVMTEQAYFHSVSQQEAFNELDVEEFEIVAAMDSHTSEICREMDGKHFPMKDYEAGVTAPPFHPFCRSVTAPWFADEYSETIAENEDTYYLPDDTRYKDWKREAVEEEVKFNSPTAENAQYSKSPRINPGNEAKFIRTPNGVKPFEITAFHADGTNNNIFISSNAREFTKPRDIHELDRRFTEVFKLLNAQNSEVLPKICVASVDEIVTNAAAAYNAIDNVIFINERIFQLPTGDFACPDNKLSTILHECIHWKDAAEYRVKFGEITKQNYRTGYLPYINAKSKKALDKLEKKEYNIDEISKYAAEKFDLEQYDETYTEYRVASLLKG